MTAVLEGKVALVTGGSRGLGRQIALAFAGAGADVVVSSRNLDSCEEVADEVRALGRSALAHACHAGHWDELDGLVAAAYAAFDQVDVLVNNAGKQPLYEDLLAVDERFYDSVVDLNLKGPFRLSALVGSRMAAGRGGSIINISSIASIRPSPSTLPYAAAKAGLDATTIGLSQALGPRVRVNSILPGGFATDISRHWAPGYREQLEAAASLGRVAEPREIAGTALYLASDASSYTTGATIRVDGGLW